MSVAEAAAYCLDLDAAAEKAKRMAAESTNPIERSRWQSHADNFANAARNMRQRMEESSVRQPTSNIPVRDGEDRASHSPAT